MTHTPNALLLEPESLTGEYNDLPQTLDPTMTDSFSCGVRSWGLDPKAILAAAQIESAKPDARTSDEILQSWSMQPLPNSDIAELTDREHAITYQTILAEAMRQLGDERPGTSKRKLWSEAQRIADTVLNDGEYPNELGFRTDPAVEVPRPRSLKERTYGLLQHMGRVLTGAGPVAVLQYYAGKAHTWFNDLPTKYRLAAGGVGIAAVTVVAEVAVLDAASGISSQLEADLTEAWMPGDARS